MSMPTFNLKTALLFTGLFLIAAIFPTCKQDTDAGVFRSDDGGENWEQKVTISEKKSIARLDIKELRVDPNDQSTVYIGTSASGVFKSTDRGEHWENILSGEVLATEIEVDPRDTNTIYVAGSFQRGLVLKTTDGGENWKPTELEPDKSSAVISLALNLKNADILYAGTSSGLIHKSIDAGKTWKRVLLLKSSIRDIKIDPQESSVVYARVRDKGMYRSTDSGENWELMKINLGGDEKTPGISKSKTIKNIDDFSISSSNNNLLIISSNSVLYRSADRGVAWEEITSSPVAPNSVKVPLVRFSPHDDSTIFLGITSTLYKSTNTGISWQSIPVNSERAITSMAFDRNDANILYVGMEKIKEKGQIFF